MSRIDSAGVLLSDAELSLWSCLYALRPSCRTWDHHDILHVEAQYNDTNKACSTSAVLTSIAPFAGRKTTAVHATDSVTGQVLRCEVFVDKISRIQIFHHSLKLDLDGLATLRIRAFDTEGT